MIIPVTIRPPGKIQALDSKSSVTSEDILSHWRSTVLLATEFSNSHIFKFNFNPLIFFFASGSQKISAHWMSNLGMKYWPLTQPLCRKTEMTTPDSITFCGQADVISLFFSCFQQTKIVSSEKISLWRLVYVQVTQSFVLAQASCGP